MTVDQLIAQLEAFKQEHGGGAPLVIASDEYMHYDFAHRCQGHVEVLRSRFGFEELTGVEAAAWPDSVIHVFCIA